MTQDTREEKMQAEIRGTIARCAVSFCAPGV